MVLNSYLKFTAASTNNFKSKFLTVGGIQAGFAALLCIENTDKKEKSLNLLSLPTPTSDFKKILNSNNTTVGN